MANQEVLARQDNAPLISRRAYNALTFGLVTLSFVIMWGTYLFASNGGIYVLGRMANPMAILIGALVATIGGLILMGVGKSRQSVPLSLVGYALFSLTFGFTLAIGMLSYDLGTITYAFGITACLSGIFLVLGVMYPDFFASLGRLLFVGLLSIILIELVAVLLFHVDQSVFDYVVIALFCGYLGYDSYRMAADNPTVPNAIWYATDIYLDIANILIRVLSILDRD